MLRGFIAPDTTTWYMLREVLNLTVGTGFADFTYLEPENYVNIQPNTIHIFGTSIFLRNPSTHVRILY